MGLDGIPIIRPAPLNCEAELELTTLLIITRFSVPTGTPAGPRMRLPSRRNSGVLVQSRMVTPVKVISSSRAPSTLSSANPRHPSKTQFEMVMFLNPPFDSVPHLMRPVGFNLEPAGHRFQVPSSIEPRT